MSWKLFDKYNCILCKYNKYNKNGDSCYNHKEKDEYGYPIGKCKSLSNIYYGNMVRWFPFNIIDKIQDKKQDKFYEDFNDDYTENSDMKLIFGVLSADNIMLKAGTKPNLLTMNDFDLIYLKKEDKYIIGVETAYIFKKREEAKKYVSILLDQFTKWATQNGYYIDDKNHNFEMYKTFTEGININTHFDSVEEAYRTFKLLVNGYLVLEEE